MRDWLVSMVGVGAALIVAAGIAWAGSMHGATFGGRPVFLLCGIFAYSVQWVVFVHAWTRKSEVYFDLTGTITYVVMVLAAVGMSAAMNIRAYLLSALIVVWALRLGPFLYGRTKRAGEDRRFRSIKTSFPMFLMTWTLQGTWVFITASCALAGITAQTSVPVGTPFIVGCTLWVFGFAIEVIADRQKTAFRARPDNAGKFINTGLWAWSRHPNYFGEIVLWLGIAMMAYPALLGWQLVTLISPLFVLVFLTFVSGVRPLEQRADKTWGQDPDFQNYRRQTPVLMLWPPRA